MAAMTSAEMRFIKRREAVPRILCAGVIALDEVFRVEEFPRPDGKVQSRCQDNRDWCRPQAAAGEHCSKFRRQIAVDLKANAHFDECRSCP